MFGEIFNQYNIRETSGKKNMIIAAGCGILGLLLCIIMLPIGLILLEVAAFFGYKYYLTSYNPKAYLKKMDDKYENMIKQGCETIDNCTSEWETINNKVSEFNGKKYNDLVA